jgi:peptidoglycan/LPS O-acetylase OafA/YrhL
MSATHAIPATRLPGLSLLRAIAILWVMQYHLDSYGLALPQLSAYGWMGVDLFFVLSGYLIGWQLLRPYTCGQQANWRQFFLRRALRVLPAYLVVLLLYFAIPAWRESEGIQPLWQFLTFTVNLFPDYLHSRAFSHAWSLSVEEHFYLLLPPVVWLLARRPTQAKTAAVMLGLLIGGMALRAWIWQHDVGPYLHSGEGRDFLLRFVEKIYNPTYTRLDGLLAGVAVAVIRGFRSSWWSWAMAHGRLILAGGALGVLAAMQLDFTSYGGTVFGYPLLAASLAMVLVAALSPAVLLSRVSVPGAEALAAMAFSLYLTHKPVYHWIRDNVGASLQGTDLLTFCVYNGAALIVAGLLYVMVEGPGQRWRARIA